MRLSHVLGAVALLAVSSFASATPDPAAERRLASATISLEKGDRLLGEATKVKTNAGRLNALDRSLYFLRRARTLAPAGESRFATVRTSASTSVVQALGDQAEIYYQRKSLSLATKRVDEILAIDANDPRARNLAGMIASAKSTDVYAGGVGTVAIQRIRERRAAAGIPLRDRGLGGRR